MKFGKHAYTFEDAIFIFQSFNRAAQSLKMIDGLPNYLSDVVDGIITQGGKEERGKIQVVTLMRELSRFLEMKDQWWTGDLSEAVSKQLEILAL